MGPPSFGVGRELGLLVFLEHFSMVVIGGHEEGLQRPCGDQPEMRVRRGQPQASDGPRLRGWISLSLLIRTQKKLQRMNGTECRPRAPVAAGGPVGFFDGGNRRDWFPGGRGREGGFRLFKVRCKTNYLSFTLILYTTRWAEGNQNIYRASSPTARRSSSDGRISGLSHAPDILFSISPKTQPRNTPIS